eukprot:m.64400 g.64400  ORF g.64400 m.64400 type:complete len:304 (-) comp12014_c0_seq1:1992-2903(-)
MCAFNEHSCDWYINAFERQLDRQVTPLHHHLNLHTSSLSDLVMRAHNQDASKDKSVIIDRLRIHVNQLPTLHLEVARLLFTHLGRVAKQHEQNKMTSSNLGTVFGPTVLRSADPQQGLANFVAQNTVVMYLIDYSAQIFYEEDDEDDVALDDAFSHYASISDVLEDSDDDDGDYDDGVVARRSLKRSDAVRSARPAGEAIVNGIYEASAQLLHETDVGEQGMVGDTSEGNVPDSTVEYIAYYDCSGEHEDELTCFANDILIDVEPSTENGWFIATLKDTGVRGLIPEAYCGPAMSDVDAASNA